jgi:hypothetical protein
MLDVIHKFTTKFIQNCSDEEVDFVKTATSIIAGFNIKSHVSNIRKIATMNAIDKEAQFRMFHEGIILYAFPDLKKQKHFNGETMSKMLNVLDIIKNNYLDNVNNPDRMEEILNNVFECLALLVPSFNLELAKAIVGIKYGKFANLEQILLHGIKAQKKNDKKDGGSEAGDSDDENNNGIDTKTVSRNVKGGKASSPSKAKSDGRDSLNIGVDISIDPDQEKAGQFFTYLSNCKDVLDMSGLKVKANLNVKVAVQVTDVDTWNQILKKIQLGEITPQDLFHILNRLGGGSGQIALSQFKILVSRLGLELSDHRIQEIFAKVKGETAHAANLTLNFKEFGVAMLYLMEKALLTTLQLLGITEEQLAVLLIILILLLILLLIFIFVGIAAFALGGSFGAVINSLFPMMGGGAMGKKSDSDEQKTSPDSLNKTVQTAVAIIQSKPPAETKPAPNLPVATAPKTSGAADAKPSPAQAGGKPTDATKPAAAAAKPEDKSAPAKK